MQTNHPQPKLTDGLTAKDKPVTGSDRLIKVTKQAYRH